MEPVNQDTGSTGGSVILLGITWLLAIASSLDKTTFSFIMATVVSLLAIINYIIQIRKNLKSK